MGGGTGRVPGLAGEDRGGRDLADKLGCSVFNLSSPTSSLILWLNPYPYRNNPYPKNMGNIYFLVFLISSKNRIIYFMSSTLTFSLKIRCEKMFKTIKNNVFSV